MLKKGVFVFMTKSVWVGFPILKGVVFSIYRSDMLLRFIGMALRSLWHLCATNIYGKPSPDYNSCICGIPCIWCCCGYPFAE